MVHIAVTGATGRMANEVLEAARERADVEVGVAFSRTPEEVDPAGEAPVVPAADVAAALGTRDPDVLVDFTAPASSVRYARAAAEAGVAAVVGTTGFDDEQVADLRAAAESVPVLRASNFAPGVETLRALVRAAVERLPEYDVELTETHHNGKRDAPSGTAQSLLDVVAAAGGPTDRRHGRRGEAPRADAEVGVHARRAGDVTGEHEVLLAGNRETLSLTHRAGDRAVFAEGALDAATWLAAQDAGWYGFADALGGASA